MNKKEIESSVLGEFKKLSEKNPRKETPYEYRELREEDFPMVR